MEWDRQGNKERKGMEGKGMDTKESLGFLRVVLYPRSKLWSVNLLFDST